MSKFRNVCFTLNNYTQDDEQVFKDAIDTQWAVYIVFSQEVGVNLTPHLQGYMQLTKQKRLSELKKFSPKAHWEGARGSPEDNQNYCKHEGRFGPGGEKDKGPAVGIYEAGVPRNPGQRTDIEACTNLIIDGVSLTDIATEHPTTFVKFHGGLTAFKSSLVRHRTEKTRVMWLHGPTGTGKSHYAAAYAGPDVYYKMGGNKWWDGYFGQNVVIIDDFRRDLCPFHELLRLFDKYRHRVEFKGGSMEFCSKTIIVTCNKHPESVFVNDAGQLREDIGQLLRRLENIIAFTIPYTSNVTLTAGEDHPGGYDARTMLWYNASNLHGIPRENPRGETMGRLPNEPSRAITALDISEEDRQDIINAGEHERIHAYVAGFNPRPGSRPRLL